MARVCLKKTGRQTTQGPFKRLFVSKSLQLDRWYLLTRVVCFCASLGALFRYITQKTPYCNQVEKPSLICQLTNNFISEWRVHGVASDIEHSNGC